MARTPREHRLETRESRYKLKARKEPYWRQVVTGTFLGYAKGARGASWIVRQRVGDGYQSRRIGIPDDYAQADGAVVLTYSQATKQATAGDSSPRRHFGDGLTVNAALDYYLEENDAAKSSNKMARQNWRRHGRESVGKTLVSELTAEKLRAWHKRVAATPPTNRGKVMPFDPEDPAQVRRREVSANRNLTIVKAALNFAWDNNKLRGATKEWDKVKAFPIGDDPMPRMLDQDEITRLLNACAPDLRRLVSGALMTGARFGELAALKVADFDSETATVRLFQSKTGKTLRQSLTPEGARLFESLSVGRKPGEHVFTMADGRPWDNSAKTRPMRAATKQAGLEDVTFSATRATYGKLLLLATKDIELVAKALGHSDSRITRKHYAALLPSEVSAGIAKLPALGINTDSKVSRMTGRKRRTGQD